MNIEYKINQTVTVDEFIDVLNRSGLSSRRPVDNRECIKGMTENSNLFISAWNDGVLVGIARSMTDFHYACYLSDLAVDREYQKSGIGKKLIALTQEQLNEQCKLILIAAPASNDYYQYINFKNNPRCWILEPEQRID